VPQVLLDSQCTVTLQITSAEEAELGQAFGMHVLFGVDPQVLCFFQAVVVISYDQPIFTAAYSVYGFVHVLHDMEAVQRNLRGCQRNGFEIGLDIGPPHGHRDCLWPALEILIQSI
jgi:hypothetical protein